jgi:pimeloyl-ACP methyl ester carboxylesterase
MRLIDRGNGDPLILIPGLQGRWEYVRPLVDALTASWRVITFDLCDEPSAEAPFDPAAPLDSLVTQVEAALDHVGLSRAVICGVSFGGIVALRFAARHPRRTMALVLVSTPGPQWHLKRRHEIYARWPLLFGPVFLAETPARLRAELRAAFGEARDRRRFSRAQLRTLVTAPLSVRRMASRARLIAQGDRRAECAAVACPTLVVHGEPALDHVVNVDGTSEYARWIPGAQRAVIGRTGHLGSITRPLALAAILEQFMRSTRRQDGHGSAA